MSRRARAAPRSYNRTPTSYVQTNRRNVAQGVIRQGRSAAMAQYRNQDFAVAVPRAPRSSTLEQQVRALIASKKRDAADVTRTTASLTTTVASCLTSSTADSTAASGTGLLDMDGDECLINNVRMKGSLTNVATLDLDPAGDFDASVRKLVVWFKKPLLVASAAGTLPPITEVLVADTITSLPVTDSANGGRFIILSDKKWNLGTNTYQAVTAVGHARVQGRSQQYYDYFVKVNKRCKFAAPSQSGSNAGGHYDSDVTAGRIDAGLLVCYTQVQVGVVSSITDVAYTRLNYTG